MHPAGVSNHAHRKTPTTAGAVSYEPSILARLRSFLAWFFAARPLPEAWEPSRIYGMNSSPQMGGDSGANQISNQYGAAQDHDRDQSL